MRARAHTDTYQMIGSFISNKIDVLPFPFKTEIKKHFVVPYKQSIKKTNLHEFPEIHDK